jgi:uncharacterized protein
MRPALLLVACLVVASRTAAATDAPSFPCDAVAPDSIAATICRNPALAALDRQMADVYAAAEKKKPSASLAAEQRGWVKGRDDCWKAKADERVACVRDAYRLRIAELQARHGLVAARGPFRWQCDDNAATSFTVTFFATEPSTLIADRGDETALMYQQPSGSGTRYAGPNERYWEHQGEATIVWGTGAAELRCAKAP